MILKWWLILFDYLCVSSDQLGSYTAGIIGGKFLERGPIAKPKRSESDPTIHYQAEDLYIGSRVQFNRHKFVLIDADEYALRYMEKYSDQVSSISQISDL